MHAKTVDFALDNHGSICLLQPLSAEAQEWADEYLSGDEVQYFGTAVVIEPRYVVDIVEGFRADGLTVW